MNRTKNWNCDGARCTDANGETRMFPLGGGANLILCSACFAYENRYRARRGGERYGFPAINWVTAKRYPETSEQSHG